MNLQYKTQDIQIDVLMARLGKQELVLRPDYQRFYIWPPKKEQLFIDSIIRSYPVPPIWIWEHELDDGEKIWEIIDGQQRLTCIKKYFENDFSFTPNQDGFLTDELKEVKLAWFLKKPPGSDGSSLPKKLQNQFKSYDIPYVLIKTEDRDLVIDIFKRLNVSSTNLSPQELRNAFFRGKFKSFVYEMTGKLQKNKFWGHKERVFRPATTDRMAGQQYVSDLVVAILENQVQDKSKKLDHYYKQLDGAFPQKTDATKRFNKVLQTLKLTIPNYSRFTKNMSDFYTLFLVLDELDQISGVNIKSPLNIKRIRGVLNQFENDYAEFTDSRGGEHSENEIFEDYRETIIGRQKEKEIRETRRKIIRGILVPVIERKKHDPVRIFSDEQKRYIWFNADDHKCGVCGNEVGSFEEYEPDHVKSWTDGGLTSITNAQITHATCNQSKGTKSQN